MTKTICGIDISKKHLDARIVPGEAYGRFANDAEGIAGLAAFCAEHKVELAAMEATGGFERMAFTLSHPADGRGGNIGDIYKPLMQTTAGESRWNPSATAMDRIK